MYIVTVQYSSNLIAVCLFLYMLSFDIEFQLVSCTYIGVGCYGMSNILLVYHKPTGFVCVSRELDLETVSDDKLDEVCCGL